MITITIDCRKIKDRVKAFDGEIFWHRITVNGIVTEGPDFCDQDKEKLKDVCAEVSGIVETQLDSILMSDIQESIKETK